MLNMKSTNGQSNTRRQVADLPALADLGLDDEDLDALARQGFVAVERRREQTYFKLRYRCDGRQRVRYVGGRDRAQAVQAALEALQSDVRLRRRLVALCQVATRSLRDAKDTLEPLLEARGLHFHGRAIRKRRERM